MKTERFYFDQYAVMVLSRDGGYSFTKYRNRDWAKVKGRQLIHKENGHRYALDRTKALNLKGWCPWYAYGFFSCFIDQMPYPKRGLLLFREPADKLHGIEIAIQPLDRLENLDITDKEAQANPDNPVMSPRMYKVLAENTLVRDAVRSTPFGGFTNWKMTTLVLGGLMLVIILLWMGGYFEQ